MQNNAWGAARRASALIGAAVAVFVGTAVPAGADAPCPHVIGPIPVRAPLGDPSHDYPQYVQDVDYASRGYVEEEYFFEGAATRYSTTPPMQTGSVVSTGHPFKSRLIVRRPVKANRFNGTVIVEWVNVTAGYNNDALWKASAEHLMREGYAFVGASAQQVGIHGPSGLRAWSPTRYGDLTVQPPGLPNDVLSHDIFSQAGMAAKCVNGPDIMAGLPVKRVIASGVSQSQGRLVTYYNSVHPISQVYDAFYLFLGIGGRLRTDIDTKVMKVNTENDVLLLGEAAVRQDDSDRLHTWEVAGTSHVSFLGFPTRQEITRRDGLPVPDASACNRPALSRVPTFKVLNAAWEALRTWMVEGIPPATAPRLVLSSTSPAVPVRDGFGNILGGIRLAEHDVAIAVNDGVNSGPGFCILYGSHIDFTPATLSALYPKHSDYVSAVNDATKANEEAGFILRADVAGTRDQAERSFIGYGNTCLAICRNTQTLRVLTDGSMIPNVDKLLKSLDDAIFSLAAGDAGVPSKAQTRDYQWAKKALQKYADDVQKLAAKGQVPATVAPDLVAAAAALIHSIDALLGS